MATVNVLLATTDALWADDVAHLLCARNREADVARATDGPACTRALIEESVDVVVLDLDLPGIRRNLNVVAQAAQAAGQPPIIVVTDSRALGERAIARGAVDRLDPSDPVPSVVRTIEHVLRRDEAMRRLRHRAEQLESANAVLANHTRALTYELRGPLATALSGMALLERHGRDLDPERAADILARASRRLESLVDHMDSLLNEVTQDAGNTLAAVSVEDALQWALTALPPRDQERLHLTTESLPFVRGLPMSLRQVLHRALSTILARNSGEDVAVNIDAPEQHGRVTLRLVDDGIDPADGVGASAEDVEIIRHATARMGGVASFGRSASGGGSLGIDLGAIAQKAPDVVTGLIDLSAGVPVRQ